MGKMKKDEVWERLKGDETEVYGQSMLDMFLRNTEHLSRKHWGGLKPAQRKLVNPEIRLKYASTVEEAEGAAKDGARDFTDALYYAAQGGHLEVCKWFVEKGAKDLDSALYKAAQRGHLEICKWLEQKGASRFGLALQGAAQGGHLDTCKWAAGKLKWIRRKQNLDNALFYAAREGHIEICGWLAENGASELDEALKTAAAHGHLEICKLLVKKGAKKLNGALQYAQTHGVREFLLKAKEEHEKG